MVHAPLPCRPNTVLVTFFGQARLCRRSLHRDKNQYSTFLYFKQLGDLGTACSIIWHHIWVGKFSWPSINWLHSWKMYILQHVPMFHVCWLAPSASHIADLGIWIIFTQSTRYIPVHFITWPSIAQSPHNLPSDSNGVRRRSAPPSMNKSIGISNQQRQKLTNK